MFDLQKHRRRRWALLALFVSSLSHAQEPKFSHKLHLSEVGLTCVVCHSSAADSTSETDDNLPSSELCLACHNGGQAPPIDLSALENHKPAERIFEFNHQFHLAMGNVAPILAAAIDSGEYLGVVPDIRKELDTQNACIACHRGLDQADAGNTGDVVDSRMHLPKMPDCLVCHGPVDNPFTCEKCHAPEVDLLPADHTRPFIDAHSTGKVGFNKLTCQPCHGRKFLCMGCH